MLAALETIAQAIGILALYFVVMHKITKRIERKNRIAEIHLMAREEIAISGETTVSFGELEVRITPEHNYPPENTGVVRQWWVTIQISPKEKATADATCLLGSTFTIRTESDESVREIMLDSRYIDTVKGKSELIFSPPISISLTRAFFNGEEEPLTIRL